MTKPKISPDIPGSQVLWVSRYDSSGTLEEIITSDKHQEKWFWYSVDKEYNLTKIGTSTNPNTFVWRRKEQKDGNSTKRNKATKSTPATR